MWLDVDNRNFSRSTIHEAALVFNALQDAELEHILWARVHPRLIVVGPCTRQGHWRIKRPLSFGVRP